MVRRQRARCCWFFVVAFHFWGEITLFFFLFYFNRFCYAQSKFTHLLTSNAHWNHYICIQTKVGMERRERLQALDSSMENVLGRRASASCTVFWICFYRKWWFVFIHALVSLFRLVSGTRFQVDSNIFSKCTSNRPIDSFDFEIMFLIIRNWIIIMFFK